MGTDPIERIRSLIAELERTSQAQDAHDSARAAQLAESARKGELGADWERVQKRVDRGETTLADVVTGKDDSPEAATIARAARKNLPGIMAAAHEKDGEDLTTALDELATIRERMAVSWGLIVPTGAEGGPAGSTEPPCR